MGWESDWQFQLSLLESPFLLRQLKLRAAVVRFSTMVSVLRSLVPTLRTLAHSRATLEFENLALRHQLEVL